MKKLSTYFITVITIMFISLTAANNAPAQSTVVIPGSFQSELGCPTDWMPDCDNTRLTYNIGSGLWVGSFTIPAVAGNLKLPQGNSRTAIKLVKK